MVQHFHIITFFTQISRQSRGGPRKGPLPRRNSATGSWQHEITKTTKDGFSGERRCIRIGPLGTVSLYNASPFGRWGVAKTVPICPGEDDGLSFWVWGKSTG